MKINSIEVTDILGIAGATFDTPKPITIIGGPNGSGKSSVAESIRMIFGASPERVRLKGEYKGLVHDGAKKGIAALMLDGQEGAFTLTLPDGKTNGDFSENGALPFCLSPELFSHSSADTQRRLLFALSGVKIGRDSVRAKLIERGASEAAADAVLPFLRDGFPAAASCAEDKQKEARGAWKAVTGEAYGALKAEGWTPAIDVQRPSQDEIADARTALEEAEKAADAAVREHGRINQAAQAYAAWRQAAPEDAEQRKASLLDQISRKEGELASYRIILEDARSKAGDGQRVGLVHELYNALEKVVRLLELNTPEHIAALHAMAVYERQHGAPGQPGDPDARAKIPELEKAIKLYENGIANARRDIAALDAALAAEAPETVTDEQIQQAEAAAIKAKKARQDARQALEAIQAAESAHASAEKRAQDAAKHQADVMAWGVIKEALQPAGIPSEFLASALAPFNDRLAQSAEDSGWRVVAVDSEMGITYGGRAYSLCSVSEKYRADLMLGEAISYLSKNRILLADAFDVLEPAARVEFFQWLDTLAANEEIDSVIALGTMASKPVGPEDSFNTFYLGNQ